MARPLHQIDTFEFPLLKGEVPPYRQTIEVIERKGTSDLLRRKTGFQSPEFQLESIDNLLDFATAQAQIGSFIQTIEAGGLQLIKDDYDFVNDGLLVVVLDVEPTVEQQRSRIAGGFQPGSNWNFELRARWRLRFVAA